jgi:leucyl aminopeptidase
MKISFAKPGLPATGTVVVGVLAKGTMTKSAQALDRKTKGTIRRAIKASRFEGNKGQSLSLLAPAGTRLDRILLVGLGKPDEITITEMENLGGRIYADTQRDKGGAVAVAVDDVSGAGVKGWEIAARMAYGARLRSYRFDKYRTKEKASDKPSLKSIVFQAEKFDISRKAYAHFDKIADGVFFTRDLVSEPANILYPAELAKRTEDQLKKLGVKVEVLGEAQMKKLGMGSLLGVGQGSERESKLVVMQYNGKGASARGEQPIAFLGKGVCFDTGGISIKPAGGMEDMKWDMGGAGVVVGLMMALAGRKAKVNAVGIIGCVENMPDGNAQRPGDIVTSMSGQTIEVINTDAEGRLVLADALWYCKERFNPKFMVNLATLTGAIIVSLGAHYAGLFSNNDDLSEKLAKSGQKIGEKLWRMPMGPEYDKELNTDGADMKNIGGRNGGSIIAAQFLQRFVDKTPWAHLDIAGVTWSKADAPTVPKGGTAFGVRLLEQFVTDYYEEA